MLTERTKVTAGVSTRDAHELLDVRLTGITYGARGTNLYEFRNISSERLPSAAPGAHIDLHLPNKLVRQYSLVITDGDWTRYVIAVKCDEEGRGGSRYIHKMLRVGECLQISTPRNMFRLNESAAHSVLFAGGIGITPIWSMVRRLIDLQRSFELHYCVRDRVEAVFRDEMAAIQNAIIHSDAERRCAFLDIRQIAEAASPEAEFYCCGPQGMMRAFEAAVAARPQERVHVEYFTPKAMVASENAFIVVLASTAQEFFVPPGATILDVLREGGVDVASSCEEGICGACETRVVSGVPEHCDSILTPIEQARGDKMMICCSGCRGGRLVLDL